MLNQLFNPIFSLQQSLEMRRRNQKNSGFIYFLSTIARLSTDEIKSCKINKICLGKALWKCPFRKTTIALLYVFLKTRNKEGPRSQSFLNLHKIPNYARIGWVRSRFAKRQKSLSDDKMESWARKKWKLKITEKKEKTPNFSSWICQLFFHHRFFSLPRATLRKLHKLEYN